MHVAWMRGRQAPDTRWAIVLCGWRVPGSLEVRRRGAMAVMTAVPGKQLSTQIPRPFTYAMTFPHVMTTVWSHVMV